MDSTADAQVEESFRQSNRQTADITPEAHSTPSNSDMGAENNPNSPDVGKDSLDSKVNPFGTSIDRSTPSQPTPGQMGRRRSSVSGLSGQEDTEPSTTRGWKRKKTGERTKDDLHKVTEGFLKSIAEDRMARREMHAELLSSNIRMHEETLKAQVEATRSARQTGVDIANALRQIADSIRYLADSVNRRSR